MFKRLATALLFMTAVVLALVVAVMLFAMAARLHATNKATDLAGCQVETLRLHPKDTDNTDDENVRRITFRTACMKAKGYNFDILVPGCSDADEVSQTACYRADGWIGGLLEQVGPID
jgi:hypothetical protein